MAAPKGHPKWGGKKKGYSDNFSQQLRSAGFSEDEIVKGVVDIARNPDHPKQYDALRDLLDRLHAKKKQVDLAIDPENNAIKFIFEDYTKK
jgi:hypothetical protein